jgi:chromatin structure-remodeling complex subunit RSC9
MRGPNIYIRCLYGLRSEIQEEQDFALHHLVKVSFERGDKYKFEGFPQLAEGLLEKALEISTLIHGIKWTVSYEEDAGLEDGDVLNGSFGTSGLYERLQTLPVLAEEDILESADFSLKLTKLNEAVLVVRNMVTLEENALFLSKFALLRDFLIIALNLPEQARLAEYRQYALDIAEQVTKFWELDSASPIYRSLVTKLTAWDRGVVLSAARALVRIGMETSRPNRLADIPLSTIIALASYLLLDSDDDLMLASLELLYQYTALSENMTQVLASENGVLQRIAPRLVSLLLHNAHAHEQRIKVKDAQRIPAETGVAVVPDDLFNQLLQFPEPERCQRWLRCCFEEAPTEDITQIAIWQAYQSRFQNNAPIAAADFIKNVSVTFSTAQAQVINGLNPRFIIKGIRPKRTPVNLRGEPYHKCLWQVMAQSQSGLPDQSTAVTQSCDQWHSTPELLWVHMVADHLSVPRKENGKFDAEAQGWYQCKWLGCTKHAVAPETNARAAAVHVRLHVGSTISDSAAGKSNELVKDAEYVRHTFYTTLVDDKGLPTGIPYMAILVLKNFARHANRQQKSGQSKEASIIETLFSGISDQLWYTFSVHKTLRLDIDNLIFLIYKANGGRGNSADNRVVGNSGHS